MILPAQNIRAADWTGRFLSLAHHVASWSKDKTKVGAILVGVDKEVRLTAFNGPPKGVDDLPERFISPEKYLFASHAEANLVAFAAREGIRTRGCTVYVTHHPCSACARSLVQAGVSRVVAAKGKFTNNESWANETRAAHAMLCEAGVEFEEYDMAENAFDLASHLRRQIAFSHYTFGPGLRTEGVTDHLAKELKEIRANPHDLEEWIDAIILSLDGAWRCASAGLTEISAKDCENFANEIIQMILFKQTKNEGRKWPNWRDADPTKAIEHDRSSEAAE